jgi:hypothetical protein
VLLPLGDVPGCRNFSKSRKRVQSNRPGSHDENPKTEQTRRPSRHEAVAPGVIEDYLFKAPKTTIIRVVGCAAATQVCLAMGFAPVFWLKMGFLDELSRGLFIASMIALSSGTCYATIFMQRRYVCAVSKSILSKSIVISTPFFIFTRKLEVEPRNVHLSPVSMRDLLGRSHTRTESEERSKTPLEQLPTLTLEVQGRRLLVDSEGVSPEKRRELLQVLGVIRSQ